MVLQSYHVQYDLHREKATHLQIMFQHIRLKPIMGKKFLIITVTINVLSPLISLRDRTFFIHQPQAIHSIYHYRYFLNTRQRLKTKVTSIYSDIPEFKYRSKGFYFSIIIIVKPDYLFLQAISLFYSLQSKSCLFRYTYVLVCVLCISCLITQYLSYASRNLSKYFLGRHVFLRNCYTPFMKTRKYLPNSSYVII